MPSTYTLISSNVLSSSAASVTFSSISSTYTDLVLRISPRSSISQVDWNFIMTINGTSANYSDTIIYANPTTVSSGADANQTNLIIQGIPGASGTANTFGSVEIYIPSYTASQNKPLSAIAMTENNSASFTLGDQVYAGLWRNTAAITSIAFSAGGANSFVSGSSFYLYGIKNS